MCGSLLSKFKKRRNKVNLVISTDALLSKRVKGSTSLVDHTLSVEESLFGGEITLTRDAFTKVRVRNSSKDKCFEVKACGRTKETAEDSKSRSLSLCLLADDFQKKKTESDSGSTVECNSSIDIQDCAFTAEYESLSSSLKKPDPDSRSADEYDSAATTEEKKMATDSGSAIECCSAIGIEEKTSEPDCGSAVKSVSETGLKERKIELDFAPAIECSSVAGIEDKNIGPDFASTIDCYTASGIEESKIGEDSTSANKSSSETGIQGKKIAPDFASAIQCNSASGIKEGRIGEDCASTVESLSETCLEDRKIELDFASENQYDSAAGIEEKKSELDSDSAVQTTSAFDLEEKKVDVDYSSSIESNAAAGLREKKTESDCRSAAECESNAGPATQKSESDCGSAVESVSVADLEEKKIETDSSSAIKCNSVASLKKKETESDFRPAAACKSDACLDEMKSESDSKYEGKCQSAAGIALQKTEPDSRSAVECGLATTIEEKTTGPECESTDATGLVGRSVTAACKSAAVLEEKKIEVDCGLTAECKSATCLIENKAASHYKCAAEWESAASLEEKKTVPEFKYEAKCQSAVGLIQKKAELELASGFEQKNTESKSKSEAEIAEETKPFLRSAARFVSKDDVQVIPLEQPNDSNFLSVDEHIRVEADILGKQAETVSTAQDDTHSSSENSGGCVHTAKRPVETYKFPTANQAALTEVQSRTCCGSLVQQFTESNLQTIGQQTSTMTEKHEKKSSFDQGSLDWNSTSSRQTMMAKTEQQVKTTTDRKVPLSRSTSQCAVDPLAVPENQEMLLALATKELEEKIMNVGT